MREVIENALEREVIPEALFRLAETEFRLQRFRHELYARTVAALLQNVCNVQILRRISERLTG